MDIVCSSIPSASENVNRFSVAPRRDACRGQRQALGATPEREFEIWNGLSLREANAVPLALTHHEG